MSVCERERVRGQQATRERVRGNKRERGGECVRETARERDKTRERDNELTLDVESAVPAAIYGVGMGLESRHMQC